MRSTVGHTCGLQKLNPPQKEGNRWKVVEMPSMEEDNLDYVGSSAYFKSLKKKFPGVPIATFPTSP